jgi:hypothetical protein
MERERNQEEIRRQMHLSRDPAKLHGLSGGIKLTDPTTRGAAKISPGLAVNKDLQSG